MTKIVVGVDGSEPACEALRWAAAEAELRSQPLQAVMAWGYLDQHHTATGDPFDPGYDEAQARLALAAYVTDVLGPDADDDVDLRPSCDLPATALLDASEDASLLVVGARGQGGFARLLLGSVSQKVLHHARCPVAVVRALPEPNAEGARQRVVVGIDGSTTADAALRWALEEARSRGATLEVVHAWHMPFVAPYPYMATACDADSFEKIARDTLDDAIRRAGPAAGDEISKLTSLSGPASLILDVAKGADLIVVGSRGLGSVKGALLGSVSHQVTLHATCPVVVIPEGAP
jgi:nucleotide-binding universal stress UspA family protein